jgi:preprotein translocase subunit SecD
MSRAKKIFTNLRVIIALVAILLAVVAIHPNPFVKGIAIRNIAFNSSASLAGIQSPKPTANPMSRERIISMNNVPIDNLQDYYDFVSSLKINRTINLKTNKGLYKLTTREKIEIKQLNETETKKITESIFNETLNKTINITQFIKLNKTEAIHTGELEDIGLSVYEAPKNNIRKGLDLQGGTRILLQPAEKVSKDEMDMLVSNMKYRLNVYGLSDIVVRDAGDLSGNQYILVEIAGAKEEEVKELLAKQGKFEATIGSQTVFRGGSDITYVCRSADCSGIDPYVGCGQTSGGNWACRFRFSISLSPEAAQKQADLTENLQVITGQNNDEEYLSEKLILYLDDKKVDELNIGADLKGKVATEIAISGSGVGVTRQESVYNSLENMKRLQTILITGSLPVKLNIVKTDSISPLFGKEFINNSLFIGLLAVIMVSVIIFLRYKSVKVAIPMVFTMLTELILLLGMAALIGWNIDLAAIAGIIIAIGTGVDHQIVIADEILKGESQVYDWKQRIKKAFFIIMASYFTTAVAMLPLLFAGAGLIKGFAITTLMGITFGVLIARPAYAAIVEILLRE